MAGTPRHAARVLGLTGTITIEDVTRERRRRARFYHPDRFKDQERASRHMGRVNAAADVLIAHLNQEQNPEAEAEHTETANPVRQNQQGKVMWTRTSPKVHIEQEPIEAEWFEETPFAAYENDGPKLPVPYNTASRAERALTEFAKTSYRRVLTQIGQQEMQRSVDMTVLRFNAPA